MNNIKAQKDNSKIMVSVIILTYNHEKYIRQALDSVLMQDVDFKYEILIGDDASTDNTSKILQEYQKNNPEIIKIVLRKENLGPTRNAYELFLLAKGEYLATCEGDDFWISSDKLRKQVQFLEEQSEYIGCSHISKIVNEQGVPLKRQRLSWVCYKQCMTLKDFKGYFLPGQASSLVRRNIYNENANCKLSFFYQIHFAIGDRTTALIYLSKGKFFQFKEAMGCYRVATKTDSITKKLYSNNKNWLIEDLAYTQRLMKFSKEILCAKVDFHFYLAYLLISALFQFIIHHNKISKKLLLQIWNTAPNKRKIIFQLPFALWKKTINHFFLI